VRQLDQPVRDLSRTPLFQASFVLLGAAPFAALELPGVLERARA
jgi:hypothetical protein